MSKVENIKKIILQIDEIILVLKNKKINKPDEMEDYFWDNHFDIMNSYPFLVTQIINNTDRKMLDYMIKTLTKIETGNQEQADADVEIGQKIVDDYIKPQLDKQK
jgi:hypothetical protein